MGKGGKRGETEFTWSEVEKHVKNDDKWLVIDGQVYDITNWVKKHPGGSKVISHYAGQDATDAFQAFHNDVDYVKKYMKAIHIGHVGKKPNQEVELEEDFRKLRKTAEKMNLFQPSFTFYAVVLGHVLLMDLLSYLVLYFYGSGWAPVLISLLLAATVQAQCGWLQHDFGHLSVFPKSWQNHYFHLFTLGIIKGASPHWWNHMHYQHHAKPNVMNKDPDVRLDKLFVVGEVMPVKVAKKKNNNPVPYNLQHKYFPFTLPLLLFPLYFQYMLFHHMITRHLYLEFTIVILYFIKFLCTYLPLLGIGSTIVFYFSMRCLESLWFTWVAQSNHIPMDIDEDKSKTWVKLQSNATCDIEKSFFNDWFTGHLNFQIEHHLFPTMPRHNLYKIAPLVKSLCNKYEIPYIVKPLGQAFADIIRTLKHSGEIWEETYAAFHSS